jgi:hypothetical protein
MPTTSVVALLAHRTRLTGQQRIGGDRQQPFPLRLGQQQAINRQSKRLLPIRRVDEVVEHHLEVYRRCGTLLQGEDPAPLRHQMIEIQPIPPLVIEHRLHQAADVEATRYAFGGIVVSERFSTYNYFPVKQRQLCWAHVIRDLTAIAERPAASTEIGAELLALKQQLFAQ